MAELADLSRSQAILIGTASYDDRKFRQMPAAANSLAQMREMLVDPSLCGWPADRVTVLADPTDVRKLVQTPRSLAHGTDDVLFIYFVGHGQILRRGQLCLVLKDTDAQDCDVTGLEYQRVREALLDSPAKVKLVMLDCCYSGRAIEAAAPAEVASTTDTRGVYTLTASDDTAHVPPLERQATATTSFTGEFIDLIREGIPAGPQTLTLSTLYPHLRRRLQRRGLPEPNQRGTDTAGEFSFARNIAYRPVEPSPSASPAPATDDVPVADPAPPSQTSQAGQESLDELYNRGLVALYTQRWDDAIEAFGAAVARDSNYQNGAAHLEQARREQRLARLYDGAAEMIRRDNLDLAVRSLEAVVAVDPGYRDAQDQLDQIRPKSPATIAGHLQRAVRDMDAGRWNDALRSLVAVRRVDPSNKGAELLAERAEQSLLASACGDWRSDQLRLERLATIRASGAVNAVAFSADSARVAVASRSRAVMVADITGKQLFTVSHRTELSLDPVNYVSDVAFSADGRLLATGGSDGWVRIWDADTGSKYSKFRFATHMSVAFSPDSSKLAAGSEYFAHVRIWNLTTERQLAQRAEGRARSIAFSADGAYLAAGNDDKAARIWEVDTGKLLRKLDHAAAVNDVAFGPNGLLATACGDRVARIWQVEDARLLREFSHSGVPATRGGTSMWSVLGLAFASNGLLATGSADNTARVWDIASRKQLLRINHDDAVRCVAFNADGTLLVTGSADKTAQIWRLTRTEPTDDQPTP